MSERLVSPNPFIPIAAESGFEFHVALSFLWRRWKFILVVLTFVLLVGMSFRLYQQPLYAATAEILLNQPREKAPGQGALFNDTDLDAAMLEGQMALIRSTVFLRRVVERAHLASDKGSLPDRRPKSPAPGGFEPVLASFFSTLSSLVDGAPSDHEPVDEERPTDESASRTLGPNSIPPAETRAIAVLQSALRVKRVAEAGYVIAISVTSPNPARAAQLANAVADTYLVDKLDARLDATKRASSWLSERLVVLRSQLHDSEEAVAEFRIKHGLVASNGNTLPQQQTSQLNASLLEAKTDLVRKQAQIELLDRIEANGGSLASMPGIANAGALQGLETQENALSAQEAELLARYRADYPLVVRIRAQLRDVARSIAAETARLAAGIRDDYRLAKGRVALLERALQQAAVPPTEPNDATAAGITASIRLHELERTAAANKVLFEDFLKQAKATQAQSTFQPQDARIITPAAPGVPAAPGKIQFMAINLFVGMLLGVGGAFVKEKLDAGFATPQQLKDLLGLPLVASVSHLARHDLRVERSIVPIYDLPIIKPLSRFGETVSSLRSSIRMTDPEHPPRVIQVASAVPREGKTTIGLSIAASAASAGLRVLFIDADLRHPTATRIFGLQNAPGLVDLLVGEATIGDVVRPYERGGYWSIGAGSKTQNPTDLLGSEKMKALTAAFREHCDLVIIDTPPIGPVIDAVVVSRLCDTVVLVVKWDATPREIVKASLTRFSGQQKIAGVAFNQVNDRQAQRYGKDAYAHYPSNIYYKNYYSE